MSRESQPWVGVWDGGKSGGSESEIKEKNRYNLSRKNTNNKKDCFEIRG